MKTFYDYAQLIAEGGNLFPETRRINKIEVAPTIKYLEKLTGLPLTDRLLGSTGKTPTSGDIDVAVDANTITKDEFIDLMVSKGVDPKDLKKTGIEVGFKSPIFGSNNRIAGGFVQVDFMFHDDVRYIKWFYASNETPPLKGRDRSILMSALAKTKNLKISINGLTNRDTNLLITRDPNEIAKRLLDDKATVKDLHSIPNIIAYLRKIYKDDNMVQQIIEPAEITSGVKYL